MNWLYNKCSLDSAIHSQLDLASFRGYQEDFLKIYVRLWLSCIKHFTPKLVRTPGNTKIAEVLLRLGTFHTIFNLLSIIGKRFQDAGLRDICTESGIIAEGSVLGILEAVRVHRCIYEALLRVIWKQFIAWETNNYPNKLKRLRAIHSEAEQMAETFSVSQYNNVLNSESLLQVYQLWSKYQEYLRHENSI